MTKPSAAAKKQKLVPNPAAKTKELPQQNTDFTSEGSPPPGKVALTVPVTTDEPSKVASVGLPDTPKTSK